MKKQFITLDGMILYAYTPYVLRDARGDLLPEKLDHALYLIHKTKVFGLELYGRIADYFIKQCFPMRNHTPMFTLKIIEGNPQDKSTWASIGTIGLCRVGLTYELASYWNLQYDGPVPPDVPRRYLIPLVLVEQ